MSTILRRRWLGLFLVCIVLAGCKTTEKNQYTESEVGRSFAISFGRVLDIAEVQILGEDTAYGRVGGAMAGGIAGSFAGSGDGTAVAVGVGILAGAILGASAERLMNDRVGLEYTLKLDSGIILAVIQEVPEEGKGPKLGERIFVKNAGGYQRVLPLADLPKGVSDPRGKGK